MIQSKKSEDEVRKHEYSEMRKEMNAAYMEIVKRREYKGARIHDILGWLADYCEKRIDSERSKYAEILKEAEELLIGVSTQKSIPLVRFHKWLESVNKLKKDKA